MHFHQTQQQFDALQSTYTAIPHAYPSDSHSIHPSQKCVRGFWWCGSGGTRSEANYKRQERVTGTAPCQSWRVRSFFLFRATQMRAEWEHRRCCNPGSYTRLKHENNYLQMALFTRGVSYQNGRSSLLGFGFFCRTVLSHLLRISTMDTESHDGAFSSLNAAVEITNTANDRSGIAPAKAAFDSVSALQTMIRDSTIDERDYIELESCCANICEALERGMNGRSDELSKPVLGAIEQLTTTVAEIRKKIVKQGKRNVLSRPFHAKSDKKSIAIWKVDLNSILHVFNTELAINTHMMVADMHRNALPGQGDTDGQHHSTQTSIPSGELPPPPPRACFGREELIEKIVGLAQNLTPIALIGVGGIGKTSIALTILHDKRTKERFGNNRRFIRCDQFNASCPHFLSRLSTVIGAGVENPEDLAPLRPFLSSREMFIVLDNAESILDPQAADAQGIDAVVEELSQISNICLCITSRISTIPADCKSLEIPTLSMEAARDTFYRIYENGEQSDPINNILGQLDFHPLSITLLATVGHQNKWDTSRLAKEWERQRTGVLRAQRNKSLAAAIELSLTSPTFLELGSDARDLLGVIAFFPQGVNEDNLEWLFPTISDKGNILDKFCLLSLTYRSNSFVTMLAPLRDHLSPKGPRFSPLLHTTKDHYFRKLSVEVNPSQPGFEEARWIISEDINVEHLLDVVTSVDPNSDDVWLACGCFMRHLYWHRRRLVVLGPKVEGLPDNHPSKPKCLFELSRLFDSVGNGAEYKRLLIHTLKLWRERGEDFEVAETLRFLSDANRFLDLYKEGISQANEALEIYERDNNMSGQVQALQNLAFLLYTDNQFDAAETAGSRAIHLSSNTNNQFAICECHRVLGHICRSKGETEKAINHYETALGIASSSNWDYQLFWIHYALAQLFFDQGRSGNAHTHIERAKLHVVNDPYNLGRAMDMEAQVWYGEHRFEDAKSEALRAADVFERLGASGDLERCRALLRDINGKTKEPVTSGG
ncbi:hypothetical protein BDM02DRAFT_935257 [Thelephora ganbajun]|uniref:Uncharacterized protein n=1 Tax=Thelephora ganbajun TaxID=370292 RepID=A0ACB6Z4P6_THEGA|nr:hypothetical protein BDM02DRAFT_935257 [Thelephora ganbajun]